MPNVVDQPQLYPESHSCPDNQIELSPCHENPVDARPPPRNKKIVPCCIKLCTSGWFITISVIITLTIIYSICVLLLLPSNSEK